MNNLITKSFQCIFFFQALFNSYSDLQFAWMIITDTQHYDAQDKVMVWIAKMEKESKNSREEMERQAKENNMKGSKVWYHFKLKQNKIS